MRPHGRARVSSRNPQAFGICQRCGFLYNRVSLRDQFIWAGATMVNTFILVCRTCYDVPNEQRRAIVVPADPVPVYRPSVQDYVAAESNQRTVSGQDVVDPKTGLPVPGSTVRITQADDVRVPQQTGEPPGGLNTLPGTDPNAPGNANPGVPYDNTSVPTTGPLK